LGEAEVNRQSFDELVGEHFEREERARKLHWQTTVVLGYNNIPLRITEEGFDASAILGNESMCSTNLERLLLGGIKAIVWSPGIPWWKPSGESLSGREKVRFFQQQLETVHELRKLTDGALQVARNVEEIRRVNETGGVAILLHLSGVNHLNDLGILREYYDLGVRMIHCGFQDWQDESSAPGSPDAGQHIEDLNYHSGRLNEHGVRTIEEMKKLGIIVDMAHIRPPGFDDIADRMEGTPFVYSHGGCHALVPHWRNLDDTRIAKIGESNGVYGIGVYTYSGRGPKSGLDPENQAKHAAVSDGRTKRTEEIAASAGSVREFSRLRFDQESWGHYEERELARMKGYPVKAPISSVVGHMQYLRDNFGPDIVGYGPDYEHTYGYIGGLEEADKTPNLTRELLANGFSESEAQAAMGHNFMRVFEAVLG